MGSTEIAEIKKAVKNLPGVLRFILVKTVREDTIFRPKFQRPRREEGGSGPTPELLVEAKEVSEEEIDKGIEQLVIA